MTQTTYVAQIADDEYEDAYFGYNSVVGGPDDVETVCHRPEDICRGTQIVLLDILTAAIAAGKDSSLMAAFHEQVKDYYANSFYVAEAMRATAA